jgi:general secretion pathway protein I
MKSVNYRSFNTRAGFTLIEVIVAVALLSVSLVMIMQLFAAGLKSSRASCDYTRAVMHAKDKMEELYTSPLHRQESGEFSDGYQWTAGAKPYEEVADKEDEENSFKLFKMKVKITWNITSKTANSFELESLKMVSAKDAENY